MSNSTQPAGLELRDVTHHYGARRAVEGVSLAVAPGEVVCLLGPSGCGKSTLLRLSAGLEVLQAGSVSVGGRLVADTRRAVPPEQRDAGLFFQDFALFPHLTVLDNVAFGVRRVARSERRDRALDMLERVRLRDRAASYPHMLSGGEQQRVALARALAPRPTVMLLDEPFGGLDAQLRRQVREESATLLKGSGAAVLLVTHDPEEATALGDRIAVMRAGRLEQVGPPGELYAHPANPFVALFLGEANQVVGEVRGGAMHTPLGPLPVVSLDGDLSDGAAVDVLVRPEAVLLERLTTASEDSNASSDLGAPPVADPVSGPVAMVERVRRLGAQTAIELRVAVGSARGSDGHPLRALRLGPVDVRPDDRVRLTFDPSGVLVFPATHP